MNFISLLIYALTSLAVGAGLVGIALDIDFISIKTYIDSIGMVIDQSFIVRTVVFLSGVLLILMFLRSLQKLFIHSKREKTIKTDTGNGQISITLTAIEDTIKKSLDDEEIISSIRPQIIPTKKDIIINLKLILRSEVNIKEFAKSIQTKIKSKLQAFLGKDTEMIINIEIRKISFPKKGLAENEIEDEEQGPLRNY